MKYALAILLTLLATTTHAIDLSTFTEGKVADAEAIKTILREIQVMNHLTRITGRINASEHGSRVVAGGIASIDRFEKKVACPAGKTPIFWGISHNNAQITNLNGNDYYHYCQCAPYQVGSGDSIEKGLEIALQTRSTNPNTHCECSAICAFESIEKVQESEPKQ